MRLTEEQWHQPMASGARRQMRLTTLGALSSAVLITLSALSLFLVGGVASKTADEIADEIQNTLYQNALRDRQHLMARDQLGLARWDLSVEKVTLNFDPSFIEDELVSSLWYDFGHERSFLIGPDNRILMAAERANLDFTERRLDPDNGLAALVALAIARHNSNRIKIDGGFSQRMVKAADVAQIAAYGFVEIDGDPMIASAMAIVPDDGEVALPEGPPVVLVSARPLDVSFIDDINAQLKLKGLVYARNADGLVPTVDLRGQTLGSFSWEPYQPGRQIWLVVVPVVGTLCGLLLAASLLLGRYIGRLSERLEESEERNRELAHRDALSGLANRLCFDKALNEAADRLAHAPFAVIACDLDRFKAVNDLHGHAAGDEVIRVVAERLREVVGENGLVGRVGGDEFVILVHAFRDRPRLSMLAQSIIASVSRPITLSTGPHVDVGISLGVATAPENGAAARPIMATADRALYASKEGGRGRAFFAEDLAPEEEAVTEAGAASTTAVDAA